MAKTRSRRKALSFPSFDTTRRSNERWFSRNGFVLHSGGKIEVIVGGSLVASFSEKDTGSRNLTLVLLSQDRSLVLENLAQAFGVSSETLRLIRRQHENDGLEAVLARSVGGSTSKVSPAARRRIEELFEQGLSVRAVHAKVGRRFGLSRATIGNVRKQWKQSSARQSAMRQVDLPIEVEVAPGENQSQVETADSSSTSASPSGTEAPASEAEPAGSASGTRAAPRESSERRALRATAPAGSPEEAKGVEAEIASQEPQSARSVQYAGGLLMVAMVASLGVYERAEKALSERGEKAKHLGRSLLRVALDSAVIALAIGERCIEGVRRLATSTGPKLLRADSLPSATWVRRILGRFCQAGAARALHFGLGGDLIRQASETCSPLLPTVFYADNHHRPYTGKLKLPKGWRMQDRRARPGASDYYLHDERGVALVRFTVAMHGSLARMLAPIAAVLRTALGANERFLIAFDRGGSFPAPMFALKRGGAEFVGYERAPFPKPSKQRVRSQGKEVAVNQETFFVLESKKNLGKGRGRVRRLMVLTPENRLVSILAQSKESAEYLVGVMFRRWRQENGFKHGVARWGLNQLDGRTAQPFSPETIVTNPERTRLERDLKVLQAREGELRRLLARARCDSSAKRSLSEELENLLECQRDLKALRPSLPTKVPLAQTELNGKLMHHETDYKTLLDTLRIACANSEAELAALLAPWLKRPREAKRALQNLFKASGSIRVSRRSVSIELDPAGTCNEKHAFAQMLESLNNRQLSLPGDPMRRRIRFKVQVA